MKKIRKPDGRAFGGLVKINSSGFWVDFKDFSLYPKDLRKLSKWLSEAVKYIEKTKGKS